jgi:hypothetical protein
MNRKDRELAGSNLKFSIKGRLKSLNACYHSVQNLSNMVPSNKYILDKSDKFICFKCKGDMYMEKAFESNQQSSERTVITEELDDPQRDMVELNQLLSSLKRCSVKEVILAEINLISAKIDSLKDLTVVNTDNTMSWSEVVAKKQKKATYTLQNKPCQIPAINNC